MANQRLTLTIDFVPWVMLSPRFTIYLLIIGFSFVYGLMNFRKLSPQIKILVLYLGIVFISEVFSRLLEAKIENSMPTYHILIPIQILFFGFFYSILIKKKSKLILLITSIITILTLINSLFVQHVFKFPTFSLLIFLLFIITLTLYHFHHLSTSPANVSITKLPEFWIDVSGLFFYSMTLFFFGFKNLFHFENIFYDWFIYSITLLMYVFYSYAIYLDKENTLKRELI